MSEHVKLPPGGTTTFSTRPVGLNTNLFGRNLDDKGSGQVTWRFVLCCKPDNVIPLKPQQPFQRDVSAGAGALVEVRNSGFTEVEVWTDY